MNSQMTLQAYQEYMHRTLFDTAVPDTKLPTAIIAVPDDIRSSSTHDKHYLRDRLAIHRNNTVFSLIEAMKDQYPVCHRLTGERFFSGLSREYVLANPPEMPALTFYGDRFPLFIEQHPACKALPYLADVARLEWLCQQALHCPDSEPLSHETLLHYPAEKIGDLQFNLVPGAELFDSLFPVDLIWHEHQKETPGEIQLQSDPAKLVVYRRGWQVEVLNLENTMFHLLGHLADSQSLAQAAELTHEEHPLDINEIPHMLLYLFRMELIRSVQFSSVCNR